MATRPTAASRNTESAAEMARQIRELRADLQQMASTIGEAAHSKADGILDSLQRRVFDFTGSAEAMVKDKVAVAEDALDQVTDYARTKPLHALALALGAGVLFGILFGRR